MAPVLRRETAHHFSLGTAHRRPWESTELSRPPYETVVPSRPGSAHPATPLPEEPREAQPVTGLAGTLPRGKKTSVPAVARSRAAGTPDGRAARTEERCGHGHPASAGREGGER
ncbi:hypothetical protein Skr01_56330 [Sphaerisporangium krabiense]|nr:hypothetical protein Skr01_56330 [Sphaerisporangium krabiense]